MAERDSFPVSCDIKGLRGGKFPFRATTSSETLPASNRPRTPLSVIRRLTRLAPLVFAAAGLTSGSPAGARSWGLEPSGAIPFPGADSVFSSFCAAISGPPATPQPREELGRRGRERRGAVAPL